MTANPDITRKRGYVRVAHNPPETHKWSGSVSFSLIARLSLFREAPLMRGGNYFPNQWDGGKACDVDAEHDHEKQEACTYAKLYPK